jgi:EAL domain-containing protein (putative c-di-GMP-specific phosphodiesterase class I)/DNA-binding NarL/FixJ family response regulator
MTDRAMIRVMLVDDEPPILRLLARLLHRIGVTHVTVCENGRRALQQIAANTGPVDLILLDVNMPDMDGVEFIRQLAEQHFAGAVLLVSGEDDRILEGVERLLKTHHLRCLGHVRKPIDPTQIEATLERLQPQTSRAQPNRAASSLIGVDRLRAAIAARQFVNHYQPKVSLKSGELLGVEALVRWLPPGGELVYPDRFIAPAEEHGLIGELTRLVLDSAIADAKRWRQAGLAINVAVNVSMNDLAALDFPDIVAALVAADGIEPAVLTFEVTESRIMQHPGTVLDVLSRLRLKRFRLAIDDFGTGHSSLAQLRDLPFDELKIDRGFVDGASGNATLRAICSASLRMAHELKMQVVAEGVEKTQDWELLRDLGCDAAQGYLIARPMPAEQIAAWSKAHPLSVAQTYRSA